MFCWSLDCDSCVLYSINCVTLSVGTDHPVWTPEPGFRKGCDGRRSKYRQGLRLLYFIKTSLILDLGPSQISLNTEGLSGEHLCWDSEVCDASIDRDYHFCISLRLA